MYLYNGNFTDHSELLSTQNRAFLYGDGLFETMKVANGKVLFFEDHYFRLMASMRILRMKIPMDFTPEYLEKKILELVAIHQFGPHARVRLTVFRNEGGFYAPQTNTISYLIECSPLESAKYGLGSPNYEVDIYKDYLVTPQLFSTLKTTSKQLYVIASVFAQENGWDNCIMLNEKKNVVELTNGNLFMLTGNVLVTPPLTEGCLNGILRKQLIQKIKNFPEIEFQEVPISPFDLQKADELFGTNVITGIQSISKYRKKEYQNDVAQKLIEALNNSILSS